MIVNSAAFFVCILSFKSFQHRHSLTCVTICVFEVKQLLIALLKIGINAEQDEGIIPLSCHFLAGLKKPRDSIGVFPFSYKLLRHSVISHAVVLEFIIIILNEIAVHIVIKAIMKS